MASVGPSDDTLQRILPILVELFEEEPEVVWLFFQTCRSWRQDLEAWGFCHKTFQLCSTLAHGGKLEHLGKIAQQRLSASNGQLERDIFSDVNAFLQRAWGSKESLHQWDMLGQWLQAASQEPEASFLSRGAASTAQIFRLPVVQWVNKPEGRYPCFCTLSGHSQEYHAWVQAVAFSLDGKRVVSGAGDNLLKIWDVQTGAEVSEQFCESSLSRVG